MKIAMDIDEVLFEFSRGYYKFAEEKGFKKVLFENISFQNPHEVLEILEEESQKIMKEFYSSPLFNQGDLVEGAKEAINSLAEYKLFFITSRPEYLREKTRKFIVEKMDCQTGEIIFSGEYHEKNGKTKDKICKDLGISLIVEDNGVHSLSYAENGIKVLLLDKPWNQGIEHKNIVRCNGWIEVLNEIKGVENDNRK